MSEQLERAQALLAAGKHGQAEAVCRSLLQFEPDHAAALYLLGTIAAEAGQDHAAMGLIGQAIERDGSQPEWYVQLATLLERSGHGNSALQLLGLGRQQLPQSPELWLAEADLLARSDRDEEAEAAYRQALVCGAGAAAAFHLSLLLARNSRLDEAGALAAEALQQRPDEAEIWLHAGQIAFDIGRHQEARAAWLQALRLSPANAAAYRALSQLLQQDAAGLYAGLDALDVPHARLGLHFYLLREHIDKHQSREALQQGQLALALEDNPLVHETLADIHRQRGELDAARTELSAAARLYPAEEAIQAQLASKRIYLDMLSPEVDERQLAAALQDWDARFGRPGSGSPPATGPAERRLRIGYVSSDFRRHSAMLMYQLLLANHDPREVEVFCYANVARPDDTTRQLQARIAHWRDISGLDDDLAAARVRQDRIDVLVDLNGHSDGNRLGLFVRRPAPLQLSGLGFGFPTGLSAFDGHFGDAVLTPPALGELHRLRLLQVSQLLRFHPAVESLDAGPPPHVRHGFVHFASGNGLYKLNDAVLDSWGEVLTALPTARLRLKTPEFDDADIRRVILARLEARGIAAERVDLQGSSSYQDHLAWYAQADIALDAFPYQGGASAFEPLWMGLPVIARQGGSRAADSLLSAIGRQEWLAASEPDYVTTAVALAQDSAGLCAARAQLRAELEASAVMDAQGLSREVESWYRRLWREALAA